LSRASGLLQTVSTSSSRSGTFPTCRVVLMTALGTPDTLEGARDSGADDLVPKTVRSRSHVAEGAASLRWRWSRMMRCQTACSHQAFTAIDDCTRIRVLKVYDACNQHTAIRFIDEVRRLPFRIHVIQTNLGRPFSASRRRGVQQDNRGKSCARRCTKSGFAGAGWPAGCRVPGFAADPQGS